jgi:hypothetical protein
VLELITINRQGANGALFDLGFLAECLLFYRKVRVVVGSEAFKSLVRRCGSDEILELCEMGCLEIEFLDNLTGVRTVRLNGTDCHDLATVAANNIKFQQASRELVEELAGPSGKGASRLFTKFNRIVHRSEYHMEILRGARNDLLDQGYLESATGNLLSYLAPEYKISEPLVFRPHAIKDLGIAVDTNINFEAATASSHKHGFPQDSSITPAYLLTQVAAARLDVVIAAKHGSDFALDPMRSILAASKFGELFKQATAGKAEIDAFQETVVDDLRCVGEVVNSGERNFRDVIRLLRAAEKFKEWLSKVEGNDNLRAEYCREVSRLEWADKLPTKSLRFLAMTGLGVAIGAAANPVVGMVGGLALNAADYFLVDQLLKGWKPNQFIEGPLKRFLTRK